MLERIAAWSDAHPMTRRMKRVLVEAPIASRAVSALDRRRTRRLESEGDPRGRSKLRWRSAPPGPGLTWGEQLSGAPAVEAAARHGVFAPGRSVLEIGPGYGRVIRSCLERDVPFARYVGLDVSERNVEYLRGTIADPRVEFVLGDAETAELEEPLDGVLSFLTFKHQYPSFEPALANLARQLGAGARIVFDLIEGQREYFQRDGQTFIREYSREEVAEILDRTSLELVAFDHVEHAPGRERLLVVARRPA